MAKKKDPVFSKDEIMSDNTHADYCRQCKDCMLWGIGNDPYQLPVIIDDRKTHETKPQS